MINNLVSLNKFYKFIVKNQILTTSIINVWQSVRGIYISSLEVILRKTTFDVKKFGNTLHCLLSLWYKCLTVEARYNKPLINNEQNPNIKNPVIMNTFSSPLVLRYTMYRDSTVDRNQVYLY